MANAALKSARAKHSVAAKQFLAIDDQLGIDISCQALKQAGPAFTGAGHFSSSICHDSTQLERLESAWQHLALAYGPTEQFIWSTSSLATLDAGRPLSVVTLDRDGECVGLAPLISRRVHGVRRLALAGLGDLHEPMDLLAADDDSRQRLADVVLRQRRPVLVDRMLAESPTVAALEKASSGRAIFVRRRAANCPYITLDATWLDPASHLNSGRRSDLRRARRKAEQAGAVTIEILSPTPADVDTLLDKAMTIEAKSWKGDTGTALAYDRRRAAFFRHYVHQAAREGVLRICFLHIGDAPAAMQIAIQQNGGFYLLKIGYDSRFATASPGLLLMQDTIRHAASAGLATYEFLGQAETWTTVWTNQERETVTLRIYPITISGLLALATDALAAGCRKLPGIVRGIAQRVGRWFKRTPQPA